jgi:hypothetical protein
MFIIFSLFLDFDEVYEINGNSLKIKTVHLLIIKICKFVPTILQEILWAWYVSWLIPYLRLVYLTHASCKSVSTLLQYGFKINIAL